MILAQQEHALGTGRTRIRTKAHPRQRGLPLHIGLIHQEIGRAHPAAILDHQVDGGVFRAGAAHAGYLAQRLAGERLQRGVLEAQQQHILRIAGALGEILPIGILVHHLGLHPGAQSRVLQPLDPAFQPARLHPDRHRCIQPGGAGGIIVHVGGDADAAGPRRLDLAEDGVELAPVLPARHLHVPDFRRAAGFTRDGDQFIHRSLDAVAFGTHVADIHAATGRTCLGQRHKLRCFGIGGRRIDHRRAQPQRALVHRRAHQRLHARQLRRRRINIAFAHFMHAHCGVAHEAGNIGRDAFLLQRGQILAQRRPADLVFDIVLPQRAQPLHLRVERAHRRAFAHDFQRHALADVTLRAAVDQQAFGRPAQHVDEARRNRLALHVGDAGAARHTGGRGTLANAGDPVPVHRQPAGIGRFARTIDDQATGKDNRFRQCG